MTIHRIVTTVFSVLLPVSAFAETVDFDSSKIGQISPGWQSGVTGKGVPRWSIEVDAAAPSKPHILKQSGEGTFPWCVKKDTAMANGSVEVKFKLISGKGDQAGGVIWCWKDGHNYYVARANALENNVAIYHTINGNRRAFKSADIKVQSNEWHTLRVDFYGGHFTVTFDGKRVIDADDRKITGSGAVGVWTKADSVTAFDDFTFGNK